MSSFLLLLLLNALQASLPLQSIRTMTIPASITMIALQDIAFDVADSRNTTSLSCYTRLVLFQHLARSTTRTKIQAICKIATSALLCRKLSSWLVLILLSWIEISWDDDKPLHRTLSVATDALWVIWAFYTFHRVPKNRILGELILEADLMASAFTLFKTRVSR